MDIISKKFDTTVSRQYDMIREIDDYNTKISSLKNKKDALLERVYFYRFNYPTGMIVNLLDIRSETKRKFIGDILRIGIYKKNEKPPHQFVVRYKYKDWEYAFLVNHIYEISIEKDGKQLFTYDLIKEFRPLNFNNIKGTHAVENYINLFIKNDNIKLGMILMAYYYLIEYYQHISKDLDKDLVMNCEQMQKLGIMFNNNSIIKIV